MRSSPETLEGEHCAKTPDTRELTLRYQTVRTHAKETPGIQDHQQHHPTINSILRRMLHLNNKQNKNTNPIISTQDCHLTQPCLSEEKQTNKNSAQISPYEKLTQTTGPTLEGGNQKEEFNFEVWEKETSNTIS